MVRRNGPLEPQAKEVTVQTHGHVKYMRTLGDVILRDGLNLNQELVKQGWCWWYRKYAPGDTVLEGLENETRAARKGLWADPHPVCRRGSGGRGKSGSRQTLLLGGAAV